MTDPNGAAIYGVPWIPYFTINIYTPSIHVLGYGYPMTDANAARKMVTNLPIFYHQEIAQIFMLAFFYQHQPDPSWLWLGGWEKERM
jgi:hypothetical protein